MELRGGGHGGQGREKRGSVRVESAMAWERKARAAGRGFPESGLCIKARTVSLGAGWRARPVTP